jgi:hypothetical protein
VPYSETEFNVSIDTNSTLTRRSGLSLLVTLYFGTGIR